ncbi:MAG: FecR domain-containing protein [Rhodobacteraceae bacterium]|jgi:hypothetical protein|nr:FecR domain-containing protein [Paracoccaceae bacterium]
MIRLTRRHTLLGAGLLPFLPGPVLANTPIGTAAEVTGDASLTHEGAVAAMAPGAALAEGDLAETGTDGLALLILETDTRLNMGPVTSVVLAKYLADVGGTITLGGADGGALVFDRPEDLPPIDLTFDTAFGQIGVRGTRFFAGPSRGTFAVFCQRGRVTVVNAGTTRDLGPGDGVNLSDGAPSEVAQWKPERIAEAFALVGLAP